MCPPKREQATRVSYNTLTHSLDSIVEIGRKSRSWIKNSCRIKPRQISHYSRRYVIWHYCWDAY